MAIPSAALEAGTGSAAAAGTVAVVAPDNECRYAAALVCQGWQPVAVDLAPRLRPPAASTTPDAPGYAHRLEHTGSLKHTVKSLRELEVSAVVAGSAAGIPLAERVARTLRLTGADPDASLLRHDRGAQAATLEQTGLPALRSVRTTSLAEALTWAENHRLPAYMLAPAAAGVPVEPVVCEHEVQISATWPSMRREAAHHSGDEHLVVAEYLSGRRYLVNSVTRVVDGQADHVVTDVWAETRASSGRLARTDLLSRHQLLTRALHMYVLRVLDALGVVCGPVTSRIAYAADRGPVLLSAVALPDTSPADRALREATGHDRLAAALDVVIPPAPGQLISAPTGHRVTRVHLHPRLSGRIDPWTARILRGLPTVAAVSPDLQATAPAAPPARTEVVLSSSEPDAIEGDYRIIRALERECLYLAAADAPHRFERPT
ncbi:predicted protein [Streptomyces viridochromogenes DSM 40736]|uniref:Predicted protein n=1 Tax=Streptomyces viridochromogenes (strain DSM 40736 / JCM 4977 / BCRC 1201 / Tue 494) TaxID=591159 RepID=D9X1T2_STRVT|nr:hypothetical protein [Streptomyces viridochromogenes]EFL29504.1 predicted protein [Streptomyces viridochromogenes DSM 40736]